MQFILCHRLCISLRCPLTQKEFWGASTQYWWLFWVFRSVRKTFCLLLVFFSPPLFYYTSVSRAVTCFIYYCLEPGQKSNVIHEIVVKIFCICFLCVCVFQAGKILLHYRDQHRQIITRFLIWGFMLVCFFCVTPFSHFHFFNVHCINLCIWSIKISHYCKLKGSFTQK